MTNSSTAAVRVEGVGRAFDIYPSEQARARHVLWSAAAHLPGIAGAAARRRDALVTRVWALRDITFEVGRGESVGIIGANGSGKSTLLHLLCGTLPPTMGQVQVAGRIAALLELGTGFVPDLTGRENVRLSGLLHGMDDATIADRADEIAAFADIGGYLDQPVRTYSSGMYVRLAFAVMAHVDAELLIVDEALAVGDIRFVQKCLAFLDHFRAAGGTLIFVSHDLAGVRRLCSRVLWIDGGQLQRDGAPREVTEAYFDWMIGAPGEDARSAVAEPAERVPQFGVTSDHHRRIAALEAGTAGDDDGRPPDAAAPGAWARQGRAHGARLVDVRLVDADDRPVSTISGLETVWLHVDVETDLPLDQPIIGFYVKDRLGQELFGENTLAAGSPPRAEAGTRLSASFAFTMPRLFPGEYLVAVAVAEGTQASHVHHEWRHEAWHFRSAWPGGATGLVGIAVDVQWGAPRHRRSGRVPGAQSLELSADRGAPQVGYE